MPVGSISAVPNASGGDGSGPARSQRRSPTLHSAGVNGKETRHEKPCRKSVASCASPGDGLFTPTSLTEGGIGDDDA